MKKISYLYSAAALLTALFGACQQDLSPPGDDENRSPHALLTVEEARMFFENRAGTAMTRSPSEIALPFAVDRSTEPDWERAEESASKRISCVDVPVRAARRFRVVRENADGRFYAVDASAKLVVVRSNETGNTANYMRVAIPDELYAGWYDGRICDMTLNCEDRVDYCGLEYYTTVDGIPVAVARYEDGTLVGGSFLYDESCPVEERYTRFVALMRDLWIIPDADRAAARGPADGAEWKYGPPGTIFIDANGFIYIYVDTDGDGISDAVTQYFAMRPGGGGSGGSSDGGGSWGGSNPSPNPGGGSDGNLGGGSIGGGSGSNGGSDDDTGNSDGDVPKNGTPQDPPDIKLPLPGDGLPNPIGGDLQPSMAPECPICGKSICICPKRVDCEDLAPHAGNSSVKTTSLYREAAKLPKYSEFLNTVKDSTFEYGMTGYRKNGIFELTDLYTDNRTSNVQVSLESDVENVACFHNHPSGLCCSVTDVTALIKLHMLYDDEIRYVYVYTQNTVYVLYLYDESLVSNFFQSEFFSRINTEYKKAESILLKQGYDWNTARLYGIAYLLEKGNAGIAILSRAEDENCFHQHRAEGHEIGNGVLLRISTYICK